VAREDVRASDGRGHAKTGCALDTFGPGRSVLARSRALSPSLAAPPLRTRCAVAALEIKKVSLSEAHTPLRRSRSRSRRGRRRRDPNAWG